jgi:hypothetical protein
MNETILNPDPVCLILKHRLPAYSKRKATSAQARLVLVFKCQFFLGRQTFMTVEHLVVLKKWPFSIRG